MVASAPNDMALPVTLSVRKYQHVEKCKQFMQYLWHGMRNV